MLKLFILFSILASVDAGASTCAGLRFVPVEPVGSSKPAPCDHWADRSSCQLANGYAHFGTTHSPEGHELLRLRSASPDSHDVEKYIRSLERSPAILELNAMRILARQKAGLDACEPNYIYIGSRPIFNMGPAFVSSKRFLVDEKSVTSNFITAEDAGAPFHIPLKMISKSRLIEDSYYDIVIAHELAHALMQDLYGLDHFERLEKRVVSRDGHFASAVTDPTLAWIEGFAEGFEAYLGEKYLSRDQQGTPYLDRVFADIYKRMKNFENWGWGGYALTIPSTMLRTAKMMSEIDQFVSDFLKAERQRPIRDNHYVLKGQMANLAHYYGIFPAAGVMSDMDEVASWDTETTDAVYSKEGVVAHFVYRALKEGLLPEVMNTILWGKPRDFWEFAEELRVELAPAQLALIEDVYKTTFTEKGRDAVRSRLRNLVDPENRRIVNAEEVERRYREALATLRLPNHLEPPRDLWVEFWNPSAVHLKVYGYLDRINLATASGSRVDAFLRTVLPDGIVRARVLSTFRQVRTEVPARTVHELAAALRQRAPKSDASLARAIDAAADQLLAMRGCFEMGCLTRRPEGR